MPTKTRSKTKRRAPMSEAKRKELADKRQEEASELHRQIANRVKELATGDEWINYIRFMASFHRYSLNNTMLMMAQSYAAGRSMPTLVAGYEQWLEKGYQVRSGERGMRIFGFSKKKVLDDDGKPVLDDSGKPRYRVFFPIVSTFDRSQVDPVTESYTRERDGKVIPVAQPLDAHLPEMLTGDDTLGIRDRVAEYVRGYGWEFAVEAIDGETNGFTTMDGSKRVVINANREPAQQAKTAIHEAAHMLMHAVADGQPAPDNVSRATRELEAESVAYVVGRMLGIDSERYSDKYLLHWEARTGGTPGEAIKATAERVQKCVKILYAALAPEDSTSE